MVCWQGVKDVYSHMETTVDGFCLCDGMCVGKESRMFIPTWRLLWMGFVFVMDDTELDLELC